MLMIRPAVHRWVESIYARISIVIYFTWNWIIKLRESHIRSIFERHSEVIKNRDKNFRKSNRTKPQKWMIIVTKNEREILHREDSLLQLVWSLNAEYMKNVVLEGREKYGRWYTGQPRRTRAKTSNLKSKTI